MTSAVNTLLDQVNRLPTIPRVISDLLAETDRAEPDVDKVSRLIGADPVLAAKLLRLANSSYYSRRSSVERIEDAVVFIGIHATRTLVMSVGLAASVQFPAEFPRQVFWRYSLHTGVAARHIASKSRQNPSTAFALGLMRAIGEPLAASVMMQGLRSVDSSCPFYDGGRTRAERRQLGFSYVDVSAALAERWRFPPQMVAALKRSEEPEPRSEEGRMGAALWAGAWIAGEHEFGRGVRHGVPDLVSERLRCAGVRDDILSDMPRLPELAQGLECLVS